MNWEFKPRPESDLDLNLARLIEDNCITIPVVHLKNQLYLIGAQRVTLEQRVMRSRARREKEEIVEVMVRVGGGLEPFLDYVDRHGPRLHRLLKSEA